MNCSVVDLGDIGEALDSHRVCCCCCLPLAVDGGVGVARDRPPGRGVEEEDGGVLGDAGGFLVSPTLDENR